MSLGPAIKPEPVREPEWKPVEGKKHLEVNSKGQVRTKIADNERANLPYWALPIVKRPVQPSTGADPELASNSEPD